MPESSTDQIARDRLKPFSPRELIVESACAAIFLTGAVALALLAEPERPFSLPLAAVFVALFAGTSCVGFAVRDLWLTPVGLVAFPMLLLLPTPYVPLLVGLAMTICQVVSVLQGRRSRDRAVLPALGDACFSLAPAVTLVVLHAQLPAWSSLPAYAAAFAIQSAFDVGFCGVRMKLALNQSLRAVLSDCVRGYHIELLLFPVGLLTAMAAAGKPLAALFVVPMIALLSIFARERDARVAQSIELSRSYRGTALLLGDLLEEDDEYTGHHTQDVVELSVAVATRMGLTEELRRRTEMGALLHDIGKIHIPDAIINKPGPLDDAEWAVMKTHTIAGQKMLDRVGGLLSNVGLVVRASHERFDGGGYPDGLAGEAIPLPARIVAVCDSFNAMTTTRSYRPAMPLEAAVAELHRCSGTQFDPAVVDALVAVIAAPGWELTLREPALAAA
jgi:HD-GYP domain-containing protein (c-di-GMP phosphodiesterase class II)